MSTKGFLGGLGQGLVQMGATYGQTSLANLEADAQRMKEERLQMMQMAQFGMQGTKNVYEMEMGEKRFGLLEEEETRKAAVHERAMEAPVGKWTLKEIKHREPTTDVLGTTTSVQLQSTYVLVNDVTGETKPYDGRYGPLPKDGGDTTAIKIFTGTESEIRTQLGDLFFISRGRRATDSEMDEIYKRAKDQGRLNVTDGESKKNGDDTLQSSGDSDNILSSLITEVEDQIDKGTVGHPGSQVAKNYKEKEAARLAALSPEAKRMMAINEIPEAQGSKALAMIAELVAHPIETVTSAIASLGIDNKEIIKTLREWDSQDKKTIMSVIDAVKARIKEIKTGAIETVESWPIPASALQSSDPSVRTQAQKQDGLILTQSAGIPLAHGQDDLRTDDGASLLDIKVALENAKLRSTATEGTDPWMPSTEPDAVRPPALPGEMPAGGLTDGPLDEVIISQMPYDSLVTLFNNAQEMVRVGIGKEEAEILFTNMELIKSELLTREPPAETTELPPELPPELPVDLGLSDPRRGDGENLLDTKVLLDPTQMHRRIDFSRGRQGEGGLSMDADYRTLPGTLSRAHGQDDPQEAGTLTRAEIKALIDPTQRHRQKGIIETDIFKMDYDESIEHIRDTVKGLKGKNKFEVIDHLFQLNGILQKQKGFKKTAYSKALNDVMIGLHTTPEKYK